MILFSAALTYAADNSENNGVIQPVPNVATKIEGTLRKDLPTNPSVRVSGDELDCPSGAIYFPSMQPLNPMDLANPDDPTSNKTYPELLPRPKPHRNEPPSVFDGPRWGTDILIADKEVGEGQDFDEDEVDNAIYAVFDTYHATSDSIIVYKSTDGGTTWNFFVYGVNTDGYVGNPKVRVLRDASGQSWVCFIGIWYEPTGARQLWSRRIRTDGTGGTWEQVASDSVLWADIDADVGTAAWIYCTYLKEGASYNSIYTARNALGGAGWVNTTNIFDDPQVFPYPAIAAGAGGNVAVAFIDDRITTNQEIRIKRSTDYGANWLSSEQVSNNSGGAPLQYTDIGYSHGSTQTGWIFATFAWPAGGHNIAYYYSTNSGVNWTYGSVILPAAGDENMSTVRCRKATGAITVAYNADPGDSTMFTWTTTGNPTGFGNGVRINDYYATGIWPPTAGWINSGGSGFSAVIYSSHAMGYRPYYDWFGNTGIAEGTEDIMLKGLTLVPNPSNDVAQLAYTLNKTGSVKISLYDATGRLINSIVNETKQAGKHTINLNNRELANGIYLIKIETPDGNTTRTMTVVR